MGNCNECNPFQEETDTIPYESLQKITMEENKHINDDNNYNNNNNNTNNKQQQLPKIKNSHNLNSSSSLYGSNDDTLKKMKHKISEIELGSPEEKEKLSELSKNVDWVQKKWKEEELRKERDLLHETFNRYERLNQYNSTHPLLANLPSKYRRRTPLNCDDETAKMIFEYFEKEEKQKNNDLLNTRTNIPCVKKEEKQKNNDLLNTRIKIYIESALLNNNQKVWAIIHPSCTIYHLKLLIVKELFANHESIKKVSLWTSYNGSKCTDGKTLNCYVANNDSLWLRLEYGPMTMMLQ